MYLWIHAGRRAHYTSCGLDKARVRYTHRYADVTCVKCRSVILRYAYRHGRIDAVTAWKTLIYGWNWSKRVEEFSATRKDQ